MQLVIGLEGLTLSQKDKLRISQPSVAGVILFKRNYESPEQLNALTTEIRQLRPQLFISVDHEGGSVQRFRSGFTALPAASLLRQRFRTHPSEALAMAECCGLIMGVELQQHGVDLSYAPLLDLDFGLSGVIGNRSFGTLTQEVIALAGATMRGMHHAGIAAIGKHFPGHGGVREDTHHKIAEDNRPLDYLWQADLLPFRQLMQQGLNGIMTAHIIYTKIDSLPATFSKIWLKNILRTQMQFNGLVISDDLDMQGSDAVGNLSKKLQLAEQAGCDLVLLCNNFDSIEQALKEQEKRFTAVNIKPLLSQNRNQIPTHLTQQLTAARTLIAHIF